MTDQVTSSVVRLINQHGIAAGIGYVGPENRIITCAHMVALALGIPSETVNKPDSEVTIDFPFVERGRNRKARIISWRTVYQNSSLPLDGMEDVAVLELIEDPQADATTANTLADEDFGAITKKIKDAEIVPFLGAGVNLCDRPRGQTWYADSNFLPSGEELSRALASEFGYPWPDSGDLLRVSQYVALMHTIEALNTRLRRIFTKDYEPTRVHKFFAALPDLLKGKGYPPDFLIVTTNYDDLLERAFGDRPYDLITYHAGDDKDRRGKLFHWVGTELNKKRMYPIENPQTYRKIELDKNRNLRKPVILKIHGAVDRDPFGDKPRDSYVITEDHYLEYLTSSDISSLLPKVLKEKFTLRSFLFLGYSLRDWNLRVFLNRIQMQQEQNQEFYQSWAIQKHPGLLEQKFWAARKVKIFDADLGDFITKLRDRVEAVPLAGGEK